MKVAAPVGRLPGCNNFRLRVYRAALSARPAPIARGQAAGFSLRIKGVTPESRRVSATRFAMVNVADQNG